MHVEWRAAQAGARHVRPDTVDQARKPAQEFLADVRGGAIRQVACTAPTVKDLGDRYMVEQSEARNKPSTNRANRMMLEVHVLPTLGKIKGKAPLQPNMRKLFSTSTINFHAQGIDFQRQALVTICR